LGEHGGDQQTRALEAGRKPLSRQRFNHRVEEMRETDLRKRTGKWTWYGIRLDDATANALADARRHV
jgi:hypothetical protein